MDSVSIVAASSLGLLPDRKESLADNPFRARLSPTAAPRFFTGRSVLPLAQANMPIEMSNMMKDLVLIDVHIFILCANAVCKDVTCKDELVKTCL